MLGLFKEAGLCPEEAEKSRPRISGFRQLGRARTYAEELSPELSHDRLDSEAPEVRRQGVPARRGQRGPAISCSPGGLQPSSSP